MPKEMQDLDPWMLDFAEHLPNILVQILVPHTLLIHPVNKLLCLQSVGSWVEHTADHRLRPESLVVWWGKKGLDCESQSCHLPV